MDAESLNRYQRQIGIPGIGIAGQELLASARVAVVGAGGLGVCVLSYLNAAGIGHLGIIDHDDVELSNLSRQVLYDQRDLGKAKVFAATDHLRAVNSSTTIAPHQQQLHDDNWQQLLSGYQMVIDASDNFATKFTIATACHALRIPHIWASAYQWYGQISVFLNDGNSPCLRCLYPEPVSPELSPDCAHDGILGPVCGTLGSLQATEALKVLLKTGNPLSGQVLSWDATTGMMQQHQLVSNPQCPLCASQKPTSDTAPAEAHSTKEEHRQTPGLQEITAEDFLQQYRQDPTAILLDIREATYYSNSPHLAPNRELPLGRIVQLPLTQLLNGTELPEALERAEIVIVLCERGQRSTLAVELLRQRNIPAVSIRGGLVALNRLA